MQVKNPELLPTQVFFKVNNESENEAKDLEES